MSLQYLTVRIGSMWYGLPLASIIEVLNLVALAELPEAGDDVLGLLTLRDHIIPVVDLRLRFHLPNPQLHLSTPVVAVRGESEEQRIGFVVDEVDRVVALSADTQIKAANSPYIVGAVQLESYVLLILDISSFFESSDLHSILDTHRGTEVVK
jgi:purine-binding chemotaxis protein CheW